MVRSEDMDALEDAGFVEESTFSNDMVVCYKRRISNNRILYVRMNRYGAGIKKDFVYYIDERAKESRTACEDEEIVKRILNDGHKVDSLFELATWRMPKNPVSAPVEEVVKSIEPSKPLSLPLLKNVEWACQHGFTDCEDEHDDDAICLEAGCGPDKLRCRLREDGSAFFGTKDTTYAFSKNGVAEAALRYWQMRCEKLLGLVNSLFVEVNMLDVRTTMLERHF